MTKLVGLNELNKGIDSDISENIRVNTFYLIGEDIFVDNTHYINVSLAETCHNMTYTILINDSLIPCDEFEEIDRIIVKNNNGEYNNGDDTIFFPTIQDCINYIKDCEFIAMYGDGCIEIVDNLGNTVLMM